MKPLVIVRAEPAASATAKAASEAGLQPIAMPLFVIEPLAWTAPDPAAFDALLLTSANAIRFGGDELHKLSGLTAHCVGAATAEAALDAGFRTGSVGAGGAESLLSSLPVDLRLLHLCGIDRRAAHAQQRITTFPVYRACETDPPNGFAAIRGAVIAVHSPRSAATLARAAERLGMARSTIAVAAISEAAAEAAGTGWKGVRHAARPTDSALLALAAQLCQNPD